MKAIHSERIKRKRARDSRLASPGKTRNTTQRAKDQVLSDKQWLREIRRMVRAISLQVDELEMLFRAWAVLESKEAVRRWFNGIVPALGARPIDLCQTARGRRAVLRELERIGQGVHQ